ncbi:MAG: filamentous hemagglutinin N-terminal domain-containing protein, partial [Symploca sp. SIO2G7]|nr:filamentous hemagglutinin N-terminal domain-containing protein [Symploca sp. SIO2G7]
MNKQQGQIQLARLAVALFLGWWGLALVLVDRVFAQILPDNTLGNEQSLVTPLNSQLEQIAGGATRGSALFHSFLEFNINEGKAVYFVNPVAIETIFSRVTGNNPSQILGTLGVLGEADLYLINPNGIVFGPDAELDIKGSFVASTANSLVLPDGNHFSATNPQTPPLLDIDVDVAIGLVFEGGPPADIVSAGSFAVGADLQLVAGNLDLEGELVAGENLVLLAEDTVKIRDGEVEPFSAVAGSNFWVQGNQGIDILALNHPQAAFQSGGNLIMVSDGIISGDARFISGGNFLLLNLAGEPGEFVSYYDPIISSVGDVVLGNYTGVALKVESMGSIQTGDITITGPDTMLAHGSDPDIDILKSSPALILRAGLDRLIHQPNVPQSAGQKSSPGSITVGNIDTTGESTINFPDFSDISRLKLNNNTQQTGNLLRLTPNQSYSTGSTFLKVPYSIDENTSFQTKFQFRLTGANGSMPADGFVFMLQNDPDGSNAVGDNGGALGYGFNQNSGNHPNTKISPSLAIEFDIYNNSEYLDNSDNHVALLQDGSQNHNNGLSLETPNFDLDSTAPRTAWIEYDGQKNELNVFVADNSNKPSQPLISEQIDLVNVVGSQAFVGFSAATGGSVSNHDIENWQFSLIEQGASGVGGTAILSAAGDITSHSIVTKGGDIEITSGGSVDTTAGMVSSFSTTNGGKINITAENNIFLGNMTSSGDISGGDINITSKTGGIFIDGKNNSEGNIIRSDTFGSSSGGNITIQGRTLSLNNGGRIVTGSQNPNSG